MTVLRKFFAVIGAHRQRYLLLLLFTVLANAFMAVLNPLLLKYLFDEGVIKKDFALFVGLAVGFILVATAWRFMNLRLSLAVQRLKNALLRSLTARLLREYYSIPYPDVIVKPRGYHASRIYDEPAAAANSAVDLGFDLAGSAVSLMAAFAVILSISPKATAVLALTVPGLVVISKRFGGRIKKHSREEKEEEGLLRGVLSRATEAYRSVRLFGLGAAAEAGLSLQAERYIGSQYQRFRNSAVYGTLSTVLASYAETLVIIVCGYEMLRGGMTFGGFMAFMNAFWIAMGGLRGVINKVPEIARTEALLDRMAEFSAAAPAAAPAPGNGARLEAVRFSYGDKPVFTGLDLEIGRGEKVLLSGGNGCGKSTLANLVCGFLQPGAGAVAACAQERISACVTPHGFIPGTLRDNLRYDALEDRGKAYADRLLADFGMAGQLDKDPDAMSAGQRKKAEVIMGLLKEADLYIFDEPLANVDAAGKHGIMDHIFERARGRTLAVIMHGDDEFLGRFDRVIKL
jgi:ABC-type multidrug transport system fused ATPase/permease subunit